MNGYVKSHVCIAQDGKQLSTGSLNFANNYAFNPAMVNMPEKDFTVEFWARTPAYNEDTTTNSFTTLFSYATHTQRKNICAPTANLRWNFKSQEQRCIALTAWATTCCILQHDYAHAIS